MRLEECANVWHLAAKTQLDRIGFGLRAGLLLVATASSVALAQPNGATTSTFAPEEARARVSISSLRA